MRKTIEQERAFYCLKCVERLKLAKNGEWFDLKNFAKPYPLKPDKIDMLWDNDWKKRYAFDGVKKEFAKSFVSQFLSKVDEVYKGYGENVLKTIKEYVKSGKNENGCIDNNIRRELGNLYSEFEPKYIDYLSDYSSHAKRLPQMIVSNGLIPTLVFYKSKGGARGQIYTDLSEIMEVIGFKPYIEWKNKEGKEGSVLIEFLLSTDFQTLRLATIEALAIANWLKRIVEVE